MQSLIFVFCSYFLLASQFLFSQTNSLNGTIYDSVTHEPIPFVNIGVNNKNAGTVSDLEGNFSLKDFKKYIGDSITFSHVSYYSKTFKVINTSDLEVSLQPREEELSEVIISSRKLKKKRTGVRTFNPLLWGALSSKNNDIIEVAQRMNIPNGEKIHLRNANIYLRTSLEEKSPFIRVNFYEATKNGPGEKIIFQDLIFKEPIKKGWLHLDLQDKAVTIKQDFYISFEFLPTNKKDLRIYSGAKILRGQGYYRLHSLGDWSKSQGAYSIYVDYEY